MIEYGKWRQSFKKHLEKAFGFKEAHRQIQIIDNINYNTKINNILN
jgi:hypothetical protein